MQQAMSDADKMREKQRIAELKKQGKYEEPKEEKKYDMSWMEKYNVAEEEDENGGVEEEKKEEEWVDEKTDK